jgi:hypothetical protein
MSPKRLFAANVFVSLLLACALNLTTLLYGAQKHIALYVDASRGADSNPGSSALPMKTISRAATQAFENYLRDISTSVVIAPGTYRERISFGAAATHANATISIQAAEPGSVIVSGADVWTGWKSTDRNAQRYEHPWTLSPSLCQIPSGWPSTLPEIARHKELVFVNGKLLNQVLSGDDMPDESYFVDYGRNVLIVSTTDVPDLNDAVVEVSVRSNLWETHHIDGLTLDGLSFTKASSCPAGSSVKIFGGSGDVIENADFEWNNWYGLQLSGVSDSSIRNITSSHNGGAGVAGYHLIHLNMSDISASFNSWRSALGAFFNWDDAGLKFLRTHKSSFNHIHAYSNQTMGLWFDTDDAGVVIENSNLSNNQLYGLKLEANQGPVEIRNTYICTNNAAGLYLLNSDSVSLMDDVLYGNKGAQIFADGRTVSRNNADWETGRNYAALGQHLQLRGNTIVGTDASQLLLRTIQSATESSIGFFSTLSSDSNTWFNPVNPHTLQFDAGGPGHRPRELDLRGWQAATGQDKNSVFESPARDLAEACSTP